MSVGHQDIAIKDNIANGGAIALRSSSEPKYVDFALS
jgi:hypothetical protein